MDFFLAVFLSIVDFFTGIHENDNACKKSLKKTNRTAKKVYNNTKVLERERYTQDNINKHFMLYFPFFLSRFVNCFLVVFHCFFFFLSATVLAVRCSSFSRVLFYCALCFTNLLMLSFVFLVSFVLLVSSVATFVVYIFRLCMKMLKL